jgi:DNA gyrase subunit A
MKLEQGDEIVSVALCSANDDILLTTLEGMCVRFPIDEVRVFSSRTSAGVRGISLGPNDNVISMSVMSHVDATPEERNAYIRRSRSDDDGGDEAETTAKIKLSDKKYEALQEQEQFVLTLSTKGYGKRSSSYAFRTTKRGGKGIVAMKTGPRNGQLVGAFPVDSEDEVMVITDDGQAIRCAIEDVRLAGRTTQGVKVLNTKSNVVSTTRIDEERE